MGNTIKILLQTTIPFTPDDWHAGRFSLLKEHLGSIRGEEGSELYEVTARNREEDRDGSDSVLSSLDRSDFDELWLFAVDTGKGLSPDDCAAITRFRQRGGGIFTARDHQDLGSSLCTLGGVGACNFFHSINPEPDVSRRQRDDQQTLSIDYPNYHSGSNGDFQVVEPVGELHELLRKPDGTPIKYFPAHPHEGSVGAPACDASARVIATGKSQATGRTFNLAVAFDRSVDSHGNNLGRAVAESTFHHFADYNWNTDMGCPTFVEESPGTGYKEDPAALGDVKQYATNIAHWLSQA